MTAFKQIAKPKNIHSIVRKCLRSRLRKSKYPMAWVSKWCYRKSKYPMAWVSKWCYKVPKETICTICSPAAAAHVLKNESTKTCQLGNHIAMQFKHKLVTGKRWVWKNELSGQ